MDRVLIVDDEPSLLETLEALFEREGFAVMTCPGGRKALECLGGPEPPDLMISDIKMPGMDGIELLRAARRIDPHLPVVLITAQSDKQGAIAACNEGAYHYLEKPFDNSKLVEVCREALEKGRVDRRWSARRRELGDAGQTRFPIGEAPAFRRMRELAARAAETDSTILIQGESGTGKELVARYIYQSGARAGNPFITVNCGALPETLLESELFGHVKGAFTGAVAGRGGLFQAAAGGTVFLDEIGETSLAFQVKLLRVLQEREITPVGSTEPVAVDVRIIAATNRELETEVEEGRFRRDLFYRLNVIPITVPPLRERIEDIPLLIDHFLERHGWREGHGGRFAPAALQRLLDYHWPGNVRELENVIEHLSVLGPPHRLGEEELPARIVAPPREEFVSDRPKPTPSLEVMEAAYIGWVLEQVGGNKKEAARVLGIDPSTLYRKLSQ